MKKFAITYSCDMDEGIDGFHISPMIAENENDARNKFNTLSECCWGGEHTIINVEEVEFISGLEN